MRKTQTFARKRKTIRNLLLAALCLLLAWSRAGFPPWTLDGLLRRTERQYLLEDSLLLLRTDLSLIHISEPTRP